MWVTKISIYGCRFQVSNVKSSDFFVFQEIKEGRPHTQCEILEHVKVKEIAALSCLKRGRVSTSTVTTSEIDGPYAVPLAELAESCNPAHRWVHRSPTVRCLQLFFQTWIKKERKIPGNDAREVHAWVIPHLNKANWRWSGVFTPEQAYPPLAPVKTHVLWLAPVSILRRHIGSKFLGGASGPHFCLNISGCLWLSFVFAYIVIHCNFSHVTWLLSETKTSLRCIRTDFASQWIMSLWFTTHEVHRNSIAKGE